MTTPIQDQDNLNTAHPQNLFPDLHEELEEVGDLDRTDFGNFKDSLRAPVHRWFTYPAGFSYKAVEEVFKDYGVREGMRVYDPFAGTGTTNIVARQQGIDSYGVEAHPFVHFVASTKLFWDFDFTELRRNIDNLVDNIQANILRDAAVNIPLETLFPELVRKCYTPEKLKQLYICREAINVLPLTPFRNLAKLGLTNLLRASSDVATGWPYIAPKKAKKSNKRAKRPTNFNMPLNLAELLRDQLHLMCRDVQDIRRVDGPNGQATLIAGDSRQQHNFINAESVDFAFTSPPYLNNYDYADRTRLETYFWGDAQTWGDITEQVRTRLIMSATTQIRRRDYEIDHFLSDELVMHVPEVAVELTPKITELSMLRLIKGGKKSYDIMVAGYFNDMLKVLRETYRVLKPDSSFLLVLGDSAPYGVYIPIDIYLGEIGKSIGFADYHVEDIRSRGGKWKDNPQRHNVALKECILTLHKGR